jgi:putative intracellular protease/amidase
MKILIVLTSHAQLGNTGKRTGFWLEEFATPYYVFADAGAEITLASPLGGQPPLDPKSDEPGFRTPATERFRADAEACARLAHTSRLAGIDPDEHDAVFYPGGHGPLWDLSGDSHSLALIEAMEQAGKPIAAVCHAPAVLLKARGRNGAPLVQGRAVTGFSNTEEEAVELSDVVPFLLENELKARGGLYSRADDWQPHAVTDGLLITGQNPASSELVAQALLRKLGAATA